MQTTDTDLLFQTSADQTATRNRQLKREAAAALGSPIEVGKVIDFVVDGSDAFVAEAGWRARRVDLTTGATVRTYKGHAGPVTAVVVYTIPNTKTKLLITASWDKTIKIWDVETLQGHADFVKCLAVASTLLISSGSDRTIKVWSLDTALNAPDYRPIQSIKRHSRPVDCIVLAPHVDDDISTYRMWTADSMGIVNEWCVSGTGVEFVKSVGGHETSVTDLLPTDEGLWSVSLDKTAVLNNLESGKADRSISLGTLPRAVCVIPPGASPQSLLLTAGDDEDVSVWATVDDWATHRLMSKIRAHSDSVTSIRLRRDGILRVVTGSLDGTLRQWTVAELLDPPPLKMVQGPSGGMTEEEERELESMMDSDTD